jgi:SH3-like domain-containing protein
MQQKWLSALALSLSIAIAPAMAAEDAAPADPALLSSDQPAPSPVEIAQEPPAEEEPQVGPVTRLPLPRYVSMKATKANVRRGPSVTHRIDWVFMRRNMPLQIVAEFGHWRRVIDQEGVGGWIHHSLLSGVRTVLVQKDMLDIHLRPNEKSPVAAQLELGVVARLHQCTLDWCRVSVAGYKGWAPKTALWGIDADEVRD